MYPLPNCMVASIIIVHHNGTLAFEEENVVVQYNKYDKIVSTPTKYPCLFKISWYPGKLAERF